MSVGASGRIVIEIEPEFKKTLYSQLDQEGITLKEWFLASAKQYLDGAGQLPLFDISDSKTSGGK